jgi:hypothetical protein
MQSEASTSIDAAVVLRGTGMATYDLKAALKTPPKVRLQTHREAVASAKVS